MKNTLLRLRQKGEIFYSDGYRTKKSELTDEGYPILRVAQLRDSGIRSQESSLDRLDRVSFDFERKIGCKISEVGDVVLSTKGTFGVTALIDERLKSCVYSPQVCFFRFPENSRIHRRWFYYWLSSSEFYSQAAGRCSQSDMAAYLSLSDLGDIQITLPDIRVQRGIARLLGALDDKIESVLRISALLQDLGDEIFAATSSSKIKLLDVAEVVMGTSPPGISYNDNSDGMPFYQGTRDFGFRYPKRRIYTTLPKKKAVSGDTLLSVRAPVGTLNRAAEDCCIGRGLAALRSKYSSLIYYSLRASRQSWASFQSEGTVFGSINQHDLSCMSVPWVETSVLDVLEHKLGLIDNSIENMQAEKSLLEQLRDTLLPELMSGRMRVDEAQEIEGQIKAMSGGLE